MIMSSEKVKHVSIDTSDISESGVLVAWYGDDFTGASAVMEVLTFAGLNALLFLDVPTEKQLAKHSGLHGIGVASVSRTKSPQWMEENLPEVFEKLTLLKPGVLHYKVCSTLDSSAQTGSIGKAIEVGTKVCQSTQVPVVISAPKMQRYQCFGHLFAGVGNEVVRLDRHPVMSRHPVTPMNESDVAAHICTQSDRISGTYLSIPALSSGVAQMPEQHNTGDQITIVTMDGIDAATEAAAGQLIWENRTLNPFVVGSQGIEFALVEHWVKSGQIKKSAAPKGIGRRPKMMSVSGSVSPSTALQIEQAKQDGFVCITFDAASVTGSEDDLRAEIDRVVAVSLRALEDGQDPLVYSAKGPDDPAVGRFRKAVADSRISQDDANRAVGEALGRVLVRVLEVSDVRRAVVSGGDTSGFVTQQLGIYALSALAPTIPGASIFRAHSDGEMDGLELALKGGQMGSPDYFAWIRDGGGER